MARGGHSAWGGSMGKDTAGVVRWVEAMRLGCRGRQSPARPVVTGYPSPLSSTQGALLARSWPCGPTASPGQEPGGLGFLKGTDILGKCPEHPSHVATPGRSARAQLCLPHCPCPQTEAEGTSAASPARSASPELGPLAYPSGPLGTGVALTAILGVGGSPPVKSGEPL